MYKSRKNYKWKNISPEQEEAQIRDVFEKKVIKGFGCWRWKGKLKANQYPIMICGEKRIIATRYSWTIHHYEIPRGMFVCHKCDNPNCTNPEHLFLGNAQTNRLDAVKKGRVPKHYMPHEEVDREIREFLLELGMPTKASNKILINIDPEMKYAIQMRALQKGISMSHWIRQAIYQKMAKENYYKEDNK